MNLSRTLAVSRKVLRSLRHDRRTVGFLVLMPIFMIAIFGYTFGGEVKDVKVVIINMDQGSLSGSFSEMIIAHLQESSTIEIVEIITDEDGMNDPTGYARQQVHEAKVWAAIVFPHNFTVDALAHLLSPAQEGAHISLMLDGSSLNIAQAVQGAVQRAMSQVITEDIGATPPVDVRNEMVYGGGLQFIDTFAPGVISLAVMMVTFMLSIISFIHERTAGTLDRLLSTPVKESEIVLGYAIAFGLIGLIQSIAVLTTAIVLFDIQIVGSIVLVLVLIFLLGVGMQGLGFLLSANARNEFQAIQFIPIILFPSILLSGVFWPIQSVPAILQPISYLLPLTYAVDAVRSVMIRGWGLDMVWLDITVLIVFAALMLAGSILLMRRKR